MYDSSSILSLHSARNCRKRNHSSMHATLSSSDILKCIFDEVGEDGATLRRAVLVCSKWMPIALRILWKQKGTFANLVRAMQLSMSLSSVSLI